MRAATFFSFFLFGETGSTEKKKKKKTLLNSTCLVVINIFGSK